MVIYPVMALHGYSPIVTDSINESSESSQLPVTDTLCISVNLYSCKPFFSLRYSFLVLKATTL